MQSRPISCPVFQRPRALSPIYRTNTPTSLPPIYQDNTLHPYTTAPPTSSPDRAIARSISFPNFSSKPMTPHSQNLSSHSSKYVPTVDCLFSETLTLLLSFQSFFTLITKLLLLEPFLIVLPCPKPCAAIATDYLPLWLCLIPPDNPRCNATPTRTNMLYLHSS